MDAEDFRLQFIVQMEISKQDQHRQFIEKYLMKLEPGTTVEDLLCRLSSVWLQTIPDQLIPEHKLFPL